MSRTIPDLHLRKDMDPENPWDAISEQRRGESKFNTRKPIFSCRESCQVSDVNKSGEVFVTQGENNRLIFKSAAYRGFSSNEKSCGCTRVKDGKKVYLHLCWHFWESDLHTKETKELLVTLDKVVRILKELDCSPSQAAGPDSRRNNGRGSAPEFDTIFGFGRTNDSTEEMPSPVESTRFEDALDEDEDLRTPEETRERNSGNFHTNDVGNGKRKLHSENVEYPNCEGQNMQGRGKSREEVHCRPVGSSGKKTKFELEPDTFYDDDDDPSVFGNNVRNTEQEGPRNFLRERERRKRARDAVLASARKAVFESRMRYGESDLSDTFPPELNKSAFDVRLERDHKNGRSVLDVDQEREMNDKSPVDLHHPRQRKVKFPDDTDEDIDDAPDSERLPDLGCNADSDSEIAGRNSLGGKKIGEHGPSATLRNTFRSMGRKETWPGRREDPVHVDANGRGTKKGPNRNTTAKLDPKRQGNISIPEVDEVFTASDWESMDAADQVKIILNQFQYLEQYFRSMHEEQAAAEGKEGLKGGKRRRADLKAGHYLMVRGFCFNEGKSVVGPIAGVKIGQTFRYREELRLLGIHRSQQAGIDYITANASTYTDTKGNRAPVAVSIVSAGGYKDNQDDGKTTLVYSGQGGFSNKTQGSRKGKNQSHDQELVRGNLALVNSYKLQIPVRVTRGLQDGDLGKKLYVYDGLYDVRQCYEETGSSGFKVWKFKLMKQAGQPPNFIPDCLTGAEEDEDAE